MRFTDEFSVTRRKADDWFDLECTEDTPLYVDPFLVFGDNTKFWSDCHQQVVDFFDRALDFVTKSGGDQKSPHWRKAERMLTFPEPKELALGLSMGHPEGSGTGEDFARRMAEALDLLRKKNITSMSYVDAFVLFCDGMGVDRIGDAFCNIIKANLVTYTQKVAKRHGAPTQVVTVRHAKWDKFGNWHDLQVELPKSPVTSGGVLLVPKRFLKDIPRVTTDGFWSWAGNNAGEVLRDDLNYDLAESLDKKGRAKAAREVARKRPDLALEYVNSIQDDDLEPYSVDDDPHLLVGWAEAGRNAAAQAQSTPLAPPQDEAAFKDFVKELATEFQHHVENTDLWKALWDDDLRKHRDERIVQAIAGAMWVQRCKASNIDISKEPNMGRGPVDFKFSAGWQKRALIEVKFISSSRFFSGVEKQLPQYLKSEKITVGYYLCVGFQDRDFEPERLQRVEDTCKALAAEKQIDIVPIYVDARHDNKPSASKIKPDPKDKP